VRLDRPDGDNAINCAASSGLEDTGNDCCADDDVSLSRQAVRGRRSGIITAPDTRGYWSGRLGASTASSQVNRHISRSATRSGHPLTGRLGVPFDREADPARLL